MYNENELTITQFPSQYLISIVFLSTLDYNTSHHTTHDTTHDSLSYLTQLLVEILVQRQN